MCIASRVALPSLAYAVLAGHFSYDCFLKKIPRRLTCAGELFRAASAYALSVRCEKFGASVFLIEL